MWYTLLFMQRRGFSQDTHEIQYLSKYTQVVIPPTKKQRFFLIYTTQLPFFAICSLGWRPRGLVDDLETQRGDEEDGSRVNLLTLSHDFMILDLI